ncbi:MAG: DUF1232 domain-containing protein [Bacteroidales bacterium]|nr:DUF1232 domain-containing protein [Bacteroidales bacterium]
MKSELANKNHNDFYKTLRKKVDHWLQHRKGGGRYTKYILLAPDFFHLLCRLSVDPEVPAVEKAKLGAAIAYFITPMDFIPEMLTGPIGYMDDVALSAYVLNSIINNVDPELVKKHWAGDENILKLTRQILARADQLIGKGVWEKVKRSIK